MIPDFNKTRLYYLVGEQFPSPHGDIIRPIMYYELIEDAERLLSLLKELDYGFSCFVIVSS